MGIARFCPIFAVAKFHTIFVSDEPQYRLENTSGIFYVHTYRSLRLLFPYKCTLFIGANMFVEFGDLWEATALSVVKCQIPQTTMKEKKIYDFRQAVKFANEYYTPSELSAMLKDAALDLAMMIQDFPESVCAMQIAVINATKFLDAIHEKGGEV